MLTFLARPAGVVLKSGESIAADLVVDCSGRSSGMTGWLQAAGYAEPPLEEISAGIAYGSRTYTMPPGWYQQHVRPFASTALHRLRSRFRSGP